MRGWKTRWRRSQLEAMQRDYLPGWYATRARRRLLAGAVAFALATFWVNAVVTWVTPGAGAGWADGGASWADVVLWAAILVVYLPSVTLLNVATRGVTALAERDLDERQVSERLRAVGITHRIMTGILVALFAATLAVSLYHGRGYSVPGVALLMLAIALFMTHFVLPLIVSGWRLPDPPPDDD
ncbi:cellobiose-specific phosphotransferase system component IIC [Streptosporangium becharense]|uniref:Cellobiose-specific phosphotransferase system component IIC n=1 Tax=Streptosporangium becharense TaxID=1816182 RepID=A0A7W9MIE4_9ACTN|nr:hypothetical protein [Streptosporangium becharense]MBB2913149.1 cellobiose-specific phosphotransferase system component IIC [Streptosporangium becharense]MBB5822132.1 cellobiose-specific phosphotransferase system component IIC [Streptosporangium becharense]